MSLLTELNFFAMTGYKDSAPTVLKQESHARSARCSAPGGDAAARRPHQRAKKIGSKPQLTFGGAKQATRIVRVV